jgi:hypothetical protein
MREIKKGRFFKCRNGLKARIYSVKGRGEFCVHGAVRILDGSWEPEQWNLEGRVAIRIEAYRNADRSDCDRDLVADWSEREWEKEPFMTVEVKAGEMFDHGMFEVRNISQDRNVVLKFDITELKRVP